MLKRITIALTGVVLILIGIGAGLFIRSYLVERKLEQPVDNRLLFIGNSFTHYNDMDQMVARLMTTLIPTGETIVATRAAPGGHAMVDHLADIEDEAGNPPLRQFLVTGSPQLRAWDLIVLQEQSQIPGFGDSSPDKQAFVQTIPKLAQYTRDTGATTMLMLTWGYLEGDPRNSGLYPDYLTMQRRLTEGYQQWATQMSNAGQKTYIAPVGLGFQIVYQDLVARGESPLAENSLFRQLYAADNIHPGLAGSYLTACIIAMSYTGQPLGDNAWTPTDLDGETAIYLRQVANRVVFGDEFSQYRHLWTR